MLLTLACLGGVGACSQEEPSGAEGSGARAGGDGNDADKPEGIGDEFPEKDVIISASCTPGTKTADDWYGGVISVDGWEPGSFKHVAHTEFRLPDTALVGMTDDTAIAALCHPAEKGDISSMRSLFDRDFTKIAVVTVDQQTGDPHVGYVDRQGKFTDLTGEAEADFGEDPEEKAAAFSPEGDAVWLTYNDGEETVVASRPVDGGHELVDHGRVPYGDLITTVGTPTKAVLGDHITLSPDGQHLATGRGVVKVPQERVFLASTVTEEDNVIGTDCTTVGWVDDDTVLCTELSNYSRVDLGPNAQPGEPILPENSDRLFTTAASPGGEQISFITEDGDLYEHWITDTTPGSTPEKVEPGGDFAALESTPVFIDWR
ncbi:hypothetical protein [Streptomyces lycii]|uniref:WD40 repeat domain-containing protein n=1 Tax=Streptomyces lycii TaxID=2654337 RepID=A0ABQ7FJJ2_9ACTN|nr:hypothetical protein [Streptomyces lycii]KAF4408545.1 hypothetical protein GCU69_14050 [Streptomyces lycii]